MIKNRCVAGSTELFFEEVLMKKNKHIGIFYKFNWYCILILFCNNIFAQYNYNVKHYNSDNGFINSCVHGITHDSAGNLYFATELGISKFDGKKFENKSFTNGLEENIITLCHKYNDKIWYVAFKKGLYYFKNNKSYCPSKEPINCQNFIIHKKQLLVMIANSIIIYELDQDDNIKEKKFEIQVKGTPMLANHYGNEYYCLTTYGLVAINVNSFKSRNILDSSLPCDIDHLSGNILYIAKEGEILRLDLKTEKFLPAISNPAIKRVGALYVDKDSSIWFGSLNKSSISLIKKNKLYAMDYIYKSSPAAVTTIYQDFQSNIWLSTYGSGVIKLTEKKLHKIGYEEGIKSDYITSFDKKGQDLFIGTNDGAYRYNYLNKQLYPLFGVGDGQDYSFVFSIKTFTDNNLLINTSQADNYSLEKNVKAVLTNYRSVAQINDTVFALTGWGGIVGFFNSKTKKVFSEYKEKNLKYTSRTHSLKFVKPGMLLCATDEGLYSITYANHYKVSDFRIISTIPKTRINDVIFAGKHYFVGGLGVFAKLDLNFKADLIKKISGTQIEEVKSFAISNKDNLLFVASLNGLFKIDLKNNVDSKILLDNDITSQEINCLLFDDTTNQLIAGTCRGVDIYDSTLFNPNLNNYLRTPQLNSFKINNDTLYDYNDIIKLSAKTDLVDIEVSTPDFEYSKLLKFCFEFDGDELRKVIVENGSFSLTNIPYGESELKISTTYDSRIFSKPLILKLIKEKPWFYTAWGIFFIVISILALFVFILTIAVKQYKKHEFKKLSAQAKLNKLTLMAYNRTMSPHFVFNVLSNIQGLINTNNIELANDYLVGFSKLLRKSIDIIQKEKISLTEEIDFLGKYIALEKMRFSDAITINFTNTIDDLFCLRLLIPPMLIQPLIENSFKYGFGNSLNGAVIDIKCFVENDCLIIIVQDNGQGIRQGIENISSGSFGIRSIKQRLQNFEGSSFEIANVDNGRGVINRISIPVKEILDNL